MQQFNASPSLRVKVFRSVRDIILFIFAWLPFFLGLWSFFTIFLLTSSFTTYHLWKHPLVEMERITWYKVTKHDTEILLSSSSSLYTTSATSKLHFILLHLHQTAQTTFSFWLKYWFWMKMMKQSWVFIQLVSRFLIHRTIIIHTSTCSCCWRTNTLKNIKQSKKVKSRSCLYK